MEEIKVGEYVRTIDGYIRKVIQVNKKGTYEGLCYGAYSVDKKYKNSIGISAKKIVKHSPNIIDLVQEGDYVNGLRITSREGNTLFISNIEHKILYEPIKNIVTKEQFNQVKYEV